MKNQPYNFIRYFDYYELIKFTVKFLNLSKFDDDFKFKFNKSLKYSKPKAFTKCQ